eukprot:CFRG4012T1
MLKVPQQETHDETTNFDESRPILKFCTDLRSQKILDVIENSHVEFRFSGRVWLVPSPVEYLSNDLGGRVTAISTLPDTLHGIHYKWEDERLVLWEQISSHAKEQFGRSCEGYSHAKESLPLDNTGLPHFVLVLLDVSRVDVLELLEDRRTVYTINDHDNMWKAESARP